MKLLPKTKVEEASKKRELELNMSLNKTAQRANENIVKLNKFEKELEDRKSQLLAGFETEEREMQRKFDELKNEIKLLELRKAQMFEPVYLKEFELSEREMDLEERQNSVGRTEEGLSVREELLQKKEKAFGATRAIVLNAIQEATKQKQESEQIYYSAKEFEKQVTEKAQEKLLKLEERSEELNLKEKDLNKLSTELTAKETVIDEKLKLLQKERASLERLKARTKYVN